VSAVSVPAGHHHCGRYRRSTAPGQPGFTATAPGRELVGDITYIRTWEGWLYLATVLDFFSKKVVGYAMDSTMTSTLVCDALSIAAHRVPVTAGATIFHSDRGTQGGFNWSTQHLDDDGGVDGQPAGWMKELTGRSPMKSPGAPSHRREIHRQFWVEMASSSCLRMCVAQSM